MCPFIFKSWIARMRKSDLVEIGARSLDWSIPVNFFRL